MATLSKSSPKAPAVTKSKVGEKKKPVAGSKAAASPKPTAAAPGKEFKLFAPEASEVFLVGDFCNWQGGDCPMRRLKDGSWKKSLKLDPGRYEYRFVVDGHWWTDPENPDRQENPYGQHNSVLVVP